MAKTWEYGVSGSTLTVHTERELSDAFLRRFHHVHSLKKRPGDHAAFPFTYDITFTSFGGWGTLESAIQTLTEHLGER